MIARPRLTLATIVLIAFAVRVAWIAWSGFEPTLSDDAGRYDFLGRSLAGGRGFINPNGNVTLFWPPGYPFLLAAIYKLWPAALLGGHEVTTALIANAAAGALTCVPVFVLARRIAAPGPAAHPAGAPARDATRAALIAAALFALLPSAIIYAGVTLTETIFACLLALALWLLVAAEERHSWPMRVAAAVVIGYAALVRGQALLLPFVALPFWLASARNGGRPLRAAMPAAARRAALVAAIAALVVLPWAVRNYAHAGQPVALATNSGIDFYIGHSAAADGRGRIVDELVFRYPDLPPAEAEARVSRDGFREGIQYATRHPAREAELAVRKTFFLFWHDHEAVAWTDAHGERYVMSRAARNALAAVSDVYYLVVLALAAAAIARWVYARRWRADAAGILLISTMLYWIAVHVAFFGDPRFHAPIMPLICVWAAVAVAPLTRARARTTA